MKLYPLPIIQISPIMSAECYALKHSEEKLLTNLPALTAHVAAKYVCKLNEGDLISLPNIECEDSVTKYYLVFENKCVQLAYNSLMSVKVLCVVKGKFNPLHWSEYGITSVPVWVSNPELKWSEEPRVADDKENYYTATGNGYTLRILVGKGHVLSFLCELASKKMYMEFCTYKSLNHPSPNIEGSAKVLYAEY